MSEIDATLTAEADGRLRLLDDDGFPVFFERPVPNPGAWSEGDTVRPLMLSATPNRGFVLKEERLFRHFRKFPDGVWRLVRVEDRCGNANLFQRDAAGRLERIDTAEGLAVTFAYDAGNLRTGATLHGVDGAQRQILRWAYDAHGSMSEAECLFGEAMRYETNAEGRIVRTARSDGYEARHTHDPEGRVVAIHTNGPYDGDRFSYDDAARVTTYWPGGDPERAIRFHIDAEGTVAAEADAAGRTLRKELDETGRLAAEIDGAGNRTEYRYDAHGNVRTLRDPEGRESHYVWDGDGNLEIALDPLSNAWDYHRDENGSLVAIEDPERIRTDFVNDAAGRPTAIMRHDGLIERRAYDAQGWLREVVDFRGGHTRYARDGFGRIVSVTDPMGAVTRLDYADAPGAEFWSPARVERPDGVVLSLETRDRGATLVARDGEGRATVYRRGLRGLLAEVEDPMGGRIRLAYDDQERLERVVNQTGREWTFARDAAGRVVGERDFDGMATGYAYDAAGRLAETRHADGTRSLYDYDRSGLVLREAVHEPDGAVRATTFGYDGRGLVAVAENDDALVAFERDRLGRVTAETVNGRRIESAYDCCGRRVERRIGERLTEYAYDPLGALTRLSVAGHAPLAFERDGLGRETRRRNGRGFRLDQNWDAVGQLLHQSVAGPDAASGPAGGLPGGVERRYAWTRALAPRAIADAGWGETAYAYDGNGQVVQARFGDGGAERYEYDPALNVVGSEHREPGEAPRVELAGAGTVLPPWLVSPGGRVREARGPRGERVRLEHDGRGRVVERRVERRGFRVRVWRYAWDGRDRLIGCTTPEGVSWRYGYDPFGRRVWKVRRGVPFADGSVGETYAWDGDVAAEAAPLMADGSAAWDAGVRWHFEPGGFAPLAREGSGQLHLAVRSRHVVRRIKPEAFGLFRPGLVDEFVEVRPRRVLRRQT